MKKQEVDACLLSNWYTRFKHHTIKSVVIPLVDDSFVDYIAKDSPLILSPGFELPNIKSGDVCPLYSDESDNEEWSDNDSTANSSEQPKEFPDMLKKITAAIKKLGGVVFPKLGWSSPKDADWVLSSFKCTTPGEIVLLIKSSTFTTHALTSQYSMCEDVQSPKPDKHELVIRKWVDIHPGSEYRCFIRNNKLIAISQRHHRAYYDHIVKENHDISRDIHRFIDDIVIGKFPSDSFVVDLSQSQQSRNGFIIVDFNPFGEITDPLLFEWSEISNEEFKENKHSVDILTQDGECCGKFRYIGDEGNIQPSEYLRYGMPQDFYDLSVGNDPTKLVDFLRMKTQNQSSDSEDNDEEWKLPQS